jgi:hypothetical protein
VLLFILFLLSPFFLLGAAFLVWSEWGRAALRLLVFLPELVLYSTGLEVRVESPRDFFKVWIQIK